MPFKVVQTRECGQLFITFCPNQWESGGKLFWPKSSLLGEKLKKKEDSQPKTDWQELYCEVKRQNLTLAQAKAAAKAMSDLSETEEEAELSIVKKAKFCNKEKTTCFNKLAAECITNQTEEVTTGTVTVAMIHANPLKTPPPVLQDRQSTSTVITSESLVATDEVTVLAEPTSTKTGTLGAPTENMENLIFLPHANQTDIPEIYSYKEINSSEEYCKLNNRLNSIEENIKTFNDDVKNIKEVLSTILNNQAVIHSAVEQSMLQMTELQVSNEEFITKSIKGKQNHSLGLNPIKDIKDLEEFEKKIMDSDYREDLQRKLSILCTRGIGQGTTSAYSIVDIMFERQFFKSCSWTGTTRSQNESKEKICFKGFSKTIGFFFNVIHQHDSCFNLNDCHKFFKTILRNAEQRCKTKPQRASTKKCRGKKIDIKTPSKTDTTLEQHSTDKQIDGAQKGIEDVLEEVLDF